MKTSLYLEAPSDLSVGTVRITGSKETVADWVATPDNRTFQRDDLIPGLYSVEIGPAGVPSQSVVFEVLEGQANSVLLPAFSALSNSGSNLSFYNDRRVQGSGRTLAPLLEELVSKLEFPPPVNIPKESAAHPTEPLGLSSESRRISIGLSEGWRPRSKSFQLRLNMRLELKPGRVEIAFPDPESIVFSRRRVRLSFAIERLRVEQCLLPLYNGGTKIIAAVMPLSPSDVELSILPADPKTRALVRALDSGTPEEASAVREHIIGESHSADPADGRADPWKTILTGLLAIRFPDVFAPATAQWIDLLIERAGWSFDAHVVRANHLLTSAEDYTRQYQDRAVVEAMKVLTTAWQKGPPFYRFTGQLFREMLLGIETYRSEAKIDISPAVVKRFDRMKAMWQRERALQYGTGSTFTWSKPAKSTPEAYDVLSPDRTVSGRLQPRDYTVLFQGRVSAGQIGFLPSEQASSSSVSMRSFRDFDFYRLSGAAPEPALLAMPALSRPLGPPADPNKGRFGGESTKGGYRLSATFESKQVGDRIAVLIRIDAEASAEVDAGDVAWFVLHPTFSPTTLKVAFRGNRAQLRIETWGGFTIGAWLPKSRVELECDLAELKDAPAVIRTD